MTSRPKILYAGTYERDYPRNQQLIRLLRRQDVEVIEIHEPFWEQLRDKSRGFGGSLKLITMTWRLCAIYVRLIVRLLRHTRSADAVVIGYIGQLDMLLLGTISRAFRIPVVFNPLVTLTDTAVEDRALAGAGSVAGRSIWLIDWVSLRLADAVLVDTPENGEYLTTRFGTPRDRIHVIHVGADENVFQSTHNGSRQPGLRVLFYGKMIPLHGIETILSAIEKLHVAGDADIHFEIIGSGQQEDLVTTFVEEYPEAPVVYRRWVAYRRLAQRIATADVVLGIFGAGQKAGRVVPNKVFQAMAIGAPIITRDSPAIRHVLEHQTSALLIAPSDAEELAGAIRSMRDFELRGRLSKRARLAFERYGSDSAIDAATGDLLASVLDISHDCHRAGRNL